MTQVHVVNADALSTLRQIPSDCVHCVVTSPPYFGLRDYGVANQIGLESTPQEYVAKLVEIFREVRRVLRLDGTCWLNLGDSYNNRTRIRTSSHKPIVGGDRKSWAQSARDGEIRMTITTGALKEKDLLGIPWECASALRAHGWWLRQEIIWHKPIAKLDVAADRPASTHEHLFLFSKSKNYYFDANALPANAKGSVWSIAATGFAGHGAAFPAALVEPCILAGCPAGGVVLDPFAGSGTTGFVAQQLGRSGLLIELNPAYVELIKQRLNQT